MLGMPKKTHKFGNVTIESNFDLTKYRQRLVRDGLEDGPPKISPDLILRELGSLASFAASLGGCQEDRELTRQAIVDLERYY
jgi:hypothetical protein